MVMKKLTINKETIVELSEQELDQVAGGAVTATATGGSRTTITGATPEAAMSHGCTATG
jgi:natural product precursor